MNGEFDFIEHIRRRAQRLAAPVDLIRGIGDDTAILGQRTGKETLITVDLLVEEVDFRLDYAIPRWLGHKSLAVSLSDIAAMGGRPRFSLLTLGITPQLTFREQTESIAHFWEEFFAGYFELAERHGVTLVGGDISSMPGRLTIDSILLGECHAGQAVKRSGARPGDGIYVTGELGASAVGLRLLLEGARPGQEMSDWQRAAIEAHLRPIPRVEAGRDLGESQLAGAMIDISDGLARDLGHLCEEGRVAAVITRDAIPVSPCLLQLDASDDERLHLAIAGGEDFELLFTAPPAKEAEIGAVATSHDLKITRIGEIIEPRDGQPPLLLLDRGKMRPIAPLGFDHFTMPDEPRVCMTMPRLSGETATASVSSERATEAPDRDGG